MIDSSKHIYLKLAREDGLYHSRINTSDGPIEVISKFPEFAINDAFKRLFDLNKEDNVIPTKPINLDGYTGFDPIAAHEAYKNAMGRGDLITDRILIHANSVLDATMTADLRSSMEGHLPLGVV